MPENPDAEKAALARLGFLALKAEQYARFPSISKVSGDWHQIAMIAAEGYNALRAHDAMKAENERLRAALHRPQCPSTKAVEIEDGASQTYPSRRGRCSVCGYKGPVKDSGNLWRHSSQAAPAGKEGE